MDASAAEVPVHLSFRRFVASTSTTSGAAADFCRLDGATFIRHRLHVKRSQRLGWDHVLARLLANILCRMLKAVGDGSNTFVISDFNSFLG